MPTCLRCQHFHPSPIDGDADPYPYEVVNKIKETKEYLGGQCTFNPAWLKVREDHFCGQHRPHQDSEKYNMSTIQLDLYDGDWKNKRIKELEADVAELRSSLKKTRKRSSNRLVRLKGLPKPAPGDEQGAKSLSPRKRGAGANGSAHKAVAVTED